ncbi:hypothetical protein NQ317_010803 [Molorchus minor]|uniref:RING-type domain-containing protein n=1 Tax=Molorchus minor TaxID=1323400 RepID=A0ABQ9IWF0_9CUCU|nr:hypothetical protein NQ317_010803 [Molorchus minor]
MAVASPTISNTNHKNFGLAKSLSFNGRGILVPSMICGLCQKSLSYRKELNFDQTIVVWSCSHCFHSSCIKSAEVSDICPQCRLKAVPFPVVKKLQTSNLEQLYSSTHLRPDLEGHF